MQKKFLPYLTSDEKADSESAINPIIPPASSIVSPLF